ncbi:MAG: hypothetical protein ABIL62_14000 [Planctomycetota bacterium]
MEIFEEDNLYKRIYGGLSMPGQRQGFISIIGETNALNVTGDRDLVLLDEAEDFDAKKLIELASGLDFRYRCEHWYGDTKGPVSKMLIREMNLFNRGPEGNKDARDLVISHTRVLDNPKPVQFIYPVLKSRLENVSQKLFPPNSLVASYMRQIMPEDVASLQIGDYPAIESLSYAVLELTKPIRRGPRQTKANNDYSRI